MDVTGGAIVTCASLAGSHEKFKEHQRGTGCSHPIEYQEQATGELIAHLLCRRLHPLDRLVDITLFPVPWAKGSLNNDD